MFEKSVPQKKSKDGPPKREMLCPAKWYGTKLRQVPLKNILHRVPPQLSIPHKCHTKVSSQQGAAKVSCKGVSKQVFP